MKKENVSKFFLILVCIYITLLLASNIVAGRLISVLGIQLVSSVIAFPLTYILSDIFTEVYGFERNKKIVWLSFSCNLLMVIVFVIVLNLPYPDSFQDVEAYNTVLGTTPRILIASLLGFLIGNFSNSIIMSRLKVLTKGKYLALRTITSTIVGEAVDTLIFITITFIGNLPNEVLIMMILNQAIAKILIEVVFTPVTYRIVKKVKEIEKEDVYDENIKYSIF